MKVSEAYAVQEILLTCDELDVIRRAISVESVQKQLLKESGYEYPCDVIERVIHQRDLYVWNIQTHGYEKRQ